MLTGHKELTRSAGVAKVVSGDLISSSGGSDPHTPAGLPKHSLTSGLGQSSCSPSSRVAKDWQGLTRSLCNRRCGSSEPPGISGVPSTWR